MAASQLAVNWNDGGQTVAGVKYRNGVLAISGNYATNGLDWESTGNGTTNDINNGFSVVKAVIVGEWGKFFFRPDIANHKLKAFQIYKADVHHRIAHRHSVSFVSTNGSHIHSLVHTHGITHTHGIPHTHSMVFVSGVFGTISGSLIPPADVTIDTSAAEGASSGAASNESSGATSVTDTTSVAVTSSEYSGPSGVLHFGRGLLVWAGESSNLDGEFTNGASLAEVTAVPITVIGTSS